MNKILLIFFFIAQLVAAQQNDFKTDALRALELSGATATIKYAKTTISKVIPANKQELFLKDFDASLPAFFDDMVKNYMEVYTHDDIKEMIVFYQTTLGKKIAINSVILLEKNQIASKKWADGLQAKLLIYMNE